MTTKKNPPALGVEYCHAVIRGAFIFDVVVFDSGCPQASTFPIKLLLTPELTTPPIPNAGTTLAIRARQLPPQSRATLRQRLRPPAVLEPGRL